MHRLPIPSHLFVIPLPQVQSVCLLFGRSVESKLTFCVLWRAGEERGWLLAKGICVGCGLQGFLANREVRCRGCSKVVQAQPCASHSSNCGDRQPS
ncbi:hypothetical protein NA56DRAFT_111584 [Hyaloscypha hepaticicola]|uniref:Uncharacterized protein n=1 Tax=Hyaloscypha hepaticicola TaxID=2082293 RepID=A0A2J6Q762_9HELO|nr:hypothetical protein NA56DRAFT_111584 [Hyaloscypha hepaticicola]